MSWGQAWVDAQRLGKPETLSDGAMTFEVAEGKTVGDSWVNGDVDPCVRLEHIVAFEEAANRPRDRHHLAIIAAHS